MCQFKSMILLEKEVFIPDYDHHQQMLEELKIKDTRANAEKLFVRVELSPTNGDVFSDPETWEYRADQDILPDWYVEEYDKQRAVEAVKKWAAAHIFVGKDNLTLSGGGTYYIKDCKNVAVENSTVEAWGNATVEALDNATVKAWGNATVTNSLWCHWNKKDTVILCDNATFKDNETKTIYQAGDWKLVLVENKEK